MRVRVMRHKFLKILSWRGQVRVWHVFNEESLWNIYGMSSMRKLYGVRFIECLRYRESTVFMNLIFSLFVVISYGKNRL